MLLLDVPIGSKKELALNSTDFPRIMTCLKWNAAVKRKDWIPDHNGDRVCGNHFVSGNVTVNNVNIATHSDR